MKHSGLYLSIAAVTGLGLLTAELLWHGIQDPGCSWFGASVLRGPSEQPAVYLTFDDGPSEGTEEVLDILDRFKAKATFFQCGANAERLPNTTSVVHKAGHTIGNHTYSHRRLCLLPRGPIQQEIIRTQTILESVSGARPTFFRPPFGLRWIGLDHAQRNSGLTSVLWSTIGYDWIWDADQISEHVLREATAGSIICLHDGRRLKPNPDIRSTLKALRQIIPELIQRGFELRALSDLPLADAILNGSERSRTP